jgi:flagellar biogenesis protein FliO
MSDNKLKRAYNATKQKFLDLDRFPEPIKLNFNKQESISTSCGSLLTIVCYVIVSIYAVQRFQKFWYRQ